MTHKTSPKHHTGCTCSMQCINNSRLTATPMGLPTLPSTPPAPARGDPKPTPPPCSREEPLTCDPLRGDGVTRLHHVSVAGAVHGVHRKQVWSPLAQVDGRVGRGVGTDGADVVPLAGGQEAPADHVAGDGRAPVAVGRRPAEGGAIATHLAHLQHVGHRRRRCNHTQRAQSVTVVGGHV